MMMRRGAPAEYTEDEKKAFYAKRRKRNIAIALALLGWVGLVYVVSMVRMGWSP